AVSMLLIGVSGMSGVHGTRQASSNPCTSGAPASSAATKALTRPAAHTGARAQHPAGIPVLLAYAASQSTAPLPSARPSPSASAPPLPQPSPGSSAAPAPSGLPQPVPVQSTSKPTTPGGTPNQTPTATPTTTSPTPTPTTTPTTSPPLGTLCVKM